MNGLLWLLVLLGPLLYVQRRLHFETQAVFLLLTRRAEIALALFSLLFFPGVLLHEGSHFLMARLLGVRTGRFSLLPRPRPDGRVQLGYVETVRADLVRDALIGLAPLLTGGAFVAWAGLSHLGLAGVWEAIASGEPALVRGALGALVDRQDFWLWFYLTFAVSSTMLPSASDRRAWPPLVLAGALALGVGLLAGAGPWMAVHLAPRVNAASRAVAVVLAITLALHAALLPPAWALRRALSRVTGLDVK